MTDIETSLSRRGFLAGIAGVGAGAVAAALLGPLAGPAAGRARARLVPRNRIGLQLYTVRDMLAANPAGTLQQIAAIGYHNVEAAGLAGLTAAQFRALTDANGLEIVGAHLNIVDLRNNLDATLDTAETLGLEWVGVGAMSYPFVFNPPARLHRPPKRRTERWRRRRTATGPRRGRADSKGSTPTSTIGTIGPTRLRVGA